MSKKKSIAYRGLAAIMTVFMLLSIIVSGIPITAHAESGITYYVDSTNGDDIKDGTSETTPWKSLTKLNEVIFQPGDRILLKANSVWNNQYLELSGSGENGNPIVINMYGEGNKPLINGNGDGALVDGSCKAVISLYNQQYWEINNLEITNDDDFNVDNNESNIHRRGISIIAANQGAVNHIYIRECYIHDIDAYNEDKDSGGIIGRLKGDTPITYYNDIKIENNTFEKIDRTGINFAYNTSTDEKYSNRNNTNVVIRNNIFNDIGGDGIIAIGCNAVLIEYNVLSNCRNRTTQASVAIFPWQCTNSLIQFNEAYLTQATDPHGDGQAFDCDYGNDGTTYQYNYSHDNEGGFMLLCSIGDANASERSYNSTVRYNISQNDEMRIFRLCGPGTRFSKIYNNTIYVKEDIDGDIVQNESWNGFAGETTFENNIFYILNDNEENDDNIWKTGQRNARFFTSDLFKYDNNSYYGIPGPDSDINKITDDPKFIDVGGASTDSDTCDVYQLQSDSSCINTGKVIYGNGGSLDFFGNVLDDGLPDIGALEYGAQPYNSETNPLPDPEIPEYFVGNFGFESGNSDSWVLWDVKPIIVNGEQHGGSYAARIGSNWSGLEQTVNGLKPDTTYTLIIWAKSDNLETPITVGVRGYGEHTVNNGTYSDAKTLDVENTQYDQLTLTFTTGKEDNHTTAQIYGFNSNSSGGGYVDDFRIAETKKEVPSYSIKELVSNRGFETGDLTSWMGTSGIYSVDNENANSGSYGIKVDGSQSTNVVQTISNLIPNTNYTLTFWGKVENEGDSSTWVGVKNWGGSYDLSATFSSTSYTQKTVQFTTGEDITEVTLFIWRGGSGLAYVDDFSIIGPTSAIQESFELVYNRGFESSSLSPWTTGDTYSIEDNNQRSGLYCAMVEGPTESGGIVQVVENLLPNTTYTFSAWGKVVNAGDNMGIGITGYGAPQMAWDINSTEYSNVTFTITTGADNTSAKIFVWKGAAGAGYIDDYSLIGPTTSTRITSIAVTSADGVNTIPKSATLQMTADIMPADATYKYATWSVINGTGSATIDTDGLLTAISGGTVTVKATAQDGSDLTGSCEVTISGDVIEVKKIKVDRVGNQMVATILPENATNKNVIWTVKNLVGEANINEDGLLTPVTNGVVRVTATAQDGSGANGSCTVHILIDVPVSEIIVFGNGHKNYITKEAGTLKMTALVMPFNATNKDITWSVINGTGSATIKENGLLKAVSNGTVTVKAVAQDGSGVEGTCVIEIFSQNKK